MAYVGMSGHHHELVLRSLCPLYRQIRQNILGMQGTKSCLHMGTCRKLQDLCHSNRRCSETEDFLPHVTASCPPAWRRPFTSASLVTSIALARMRPPVSLRGPRASVHTDETSERDLSGTHDTGTAASWSRERVCAYFMPHISYIRYSSQTKKN